VANYTKATNFATKDALLTGNPAKIIKGTEIDDEYNAIAVAIQTKADLVSPTFTGTPLAPTAAGGTNTTQIATTAFVKAAVDAAMAALYPVGSIYTNATNSTNPGTLLGFGTWTAFGAGRVMVGFDSTDALFDSAEETGGSKDAVVVSHTHTASTNSTGAHQHYVAGSTYSGGNAGALESNANNTLKVGDNLGGNQNQYNLQSTTSTADKGLTNSAGAHSHTVSVDSTGSSATNANIQPYITVYMWKRTA
jgi:hypothetical protein